MAVAIKVSSAYTLTKVAITGGIRLVFKYVGLPTPTFLDITKEELGIQDDLDALQTSINGKVGFDIVGFPGGIPYMDASSKILPQFIPSGVMGAMEYMGTFQPSGGVFPANPEKGDYYVATNSGTISGKSFETGDWAVFNGTTWDEIDNQSKVSSVNGKTGAVTIEQTDISGLTSALNAKVVSVNGKTGPSVTIEQGDISGLTSALAGKLAGIEGNFSGVAENVWPGNPSLFFKYAKVGPLIIVAFPIMTEACNPGFGGNINFPAGTVPLAIRPNPGGAIFASGLLTYQNGAANAGPMIFWGDGSITVYRTSQLGGWDYLGASGTGWFASTVFYSV